MERTANKRRVASLFTAPLPRTNPAPSSRSGSGVGGDMALCPGTLNAISICAGAGGLDLALQLAEPRARTVAYVEREAEAWCQPSAPGHPTHDGQTSLTPIPFSALPSEPSISGPLLAEISVYRKWSERSGGAAGWRGTWVRTPRRRLSVKFAEYLMGWPTGWTRCDSSVTAFIRWRSDMRGLLSTLCSQEPAQGMLL